ncbi:outer membrane beta-barrel protein [Chitinophaga sancti]|uniref:outer membrane beta-barrel protein n=1 Tax=Chitinophaga sancti TaxID=1004 RepID=UPI002A75F27F|nr:outer membrane beta-barrel protein [Chitinophaga sancti]WPQ62751.1 outer membrane beta-barrel protein [Chitinophaga sancti]
MRPIIAIFISLFPVIQASAQDTSKPKQVQLKSIEVISKKPLLEQSIDRTVVNVDAMISAASSNTLEVLNKTPGVTVDHNGTIQLNGKGVLVLINGRATYMSGQDLANYLKGLPGSTLDKIELMDAPPAKYDAGGGAVINLRLKKNTILGLTGNISLSASQGIYTRSNNSLNINYNYKKMNWFASFSYNRDAAYDDDKTNRDYFADSLSVYLHTHVKGRSNTKGIRLGMDYNLNAKNVIGFEVNAQQRPSIYTRGYTSDANNDSISKGFTYSDANWKNFSGNLNFLHRFNNKGHELSADASYISYNNHDEQNLNNDDDFFHYRLWSDMQIFAVKADYVHPIGIEAGAKSSFVKNDYDSRYYNEKWVQVDSNSNHFIYDENINAAYISAKKKWKRWGAQAGLRVENTNITGRQPGNTAYATSVFKRNYTQLFPTVFLSYKLDSAGNQTLSWNIGRRVNRPNYQQLNPFVAFANSYTYETGNPNLRPQTNYRTELKYQYKQWLGLGLQYNWFRDIIFTMSDVVDNIYITKPDNVAKGYIAMLLVNLNLHPAKWWDMNANIMAGKMQLHGEAFSTALNSGTYSVRVRLYNQFDLTHGWSAEASGDYSGRNINGQEVINPRYIIYAGVQKKLWHNKATLKLNMDDIFRSSGQNSHSAGVKDSYYTHRGLYDSQKVGIAFTYRFGKETFARKRNHSDNTADQEQERAK